MTTTYTLTLTISAQDLGTIYQAGENIILAKAFSDSTSNMAWLSFRPFEANQVSWIEECGLYASRQENAVQVQVATKIGIPSGEYFNYVNDNFEGPFTGEGAPPTGSYRVFNQDAGMSVDFGMFQQASFNGQEVAGSPTISVNIPNQQFATFTPQTAVYVWLQSGVKTGQTVQVPPPAHGSGSGSDLPKSVSSRSTLVEFGTSTSLTYHYDASVGAFVPGA
jgi:hypothetical protein